MGASAREIEREIRETRDRMDDNLTRLEGNAASSAVRYGRLAGITAGVLVVAGAAFLVYRRTRKPTLRDRMNDISMENLRALLEKFRGEIPSVTVRVNEKPDREPGVLESTMREVAPAVVAFATRTVLDRVARSSKTDPARADSAKAAIRAG